MNEKRKEKIKGGAGTPPFEELLGEKLYPLSTIIGNPQNLSSKKRCNLEKNTPLVLSAFGNRERASDEGFYTISEDGGDFLCQDFEDLNDLIKSIFNYIRFHPVKDLNDLIKSICEFVESHPLPDPCSELETTPDEIAFLYVLDILCTERIIDVEHLLFMYDIQDFIESILDIIKSHQAKQNKKKICQDDQERKNE